VKKYQNNKELRPSRDFIRRRLIEVPDCIEEWREIVESWEMSAPQIFMHRRDFEQILEQQEEEGRGRGDTSTTTHGPRGQSVGNAGAETLRDA